MNKNLDLYIEISSASELFPMENLSQCALISCFFLFISVRRQTPANLRVISSTVSSEVAFQKASSTWVAWASTLTDPKKLFRCMEMSVSLVSSFNHQTDELNKMSKRYYNCVSRIIDVEGIIMDDTVILCSVSCFAVTI